MYNVGTKQQIYQTAKRLFFEEGYRVGSRKIASEAGANQGLITYYFRNKENIAMMVLREIYELIAIHLRYFVNPQEETLLYIISFINTMTQIAFSDVRYQRFIQEISEINLMQKSIVLKDNQAKLYQSLIKKYKPDSKDPYQDYLILLSFVFGTYRNLSPYFQPTKNNDSSMLLEVNVRSFYAGLNLPNDEDSIQNIMSTSNKIVSAMFNQYPTLTNLDSWIFQERKLD